MAYCTLFSLDWLRSVLSPKEFKWVAATVGLSTLISILTVKADKVLENQIKAREERSILRAEVRRANESCEFVKGQNSERTRFNHDFAERLLRMENFFYIRDIDVESGEFPRK